jgi:hypothetical protein
MQLSDLRWADRPQGRKLTRVYGMLLCYDGKGTYHFAISETMGLMSYPLLAKFKVASKRMDEFTMDFVLMEMERALEENPSLVPDHKSFVTYLPEPNNLGK